MTDDLDHRGIRRLGVVITATTVMILALALASPLGGGAVWALLVLGLFGATGIGLLARARFARVLGGLVLLAGGVAMSVSLIRALASQPPLGTDVGAWLAVVNAVATTVLLVWLCIRGIQIVLGRSRPAASVSPRIAGGTLAVIAGHHLWLAAQSGYPAAGSWSVHMAPEGTQMIGFPGWPIWQLALLVLSLVLLAGPRRIARHAATGLLVLFVALLPLVLVIAARTGFFAPGMLAMGLPIFGILLFPIYMSWWLRAELPRAAAVRREI